MGKHDETASEKLDRCSIPEPNSGCLIWTGSIRENGYGQISLSKNDPIRQTTNTKGRMFAAHRVSFELANGPIPDNLSVLHRCDNRLCINPDHLFLGTHNDNMVDMMSKGRYKNALLAKGRAWREHQQLAKNIKL